MGKIDYYFPTTALGAGVIEAIRYADDFGSWVRVSHRDVVRCEFADEIRSPESRMSVSWVYLYGDDGLRFIDRANTVDEVELTQTEPVERSTIRQMARFRKQYLMFAPLPGRLIFMDGDLWRVIEGAGQRRGGNVFLERVEAE